MADTDDDLRAAFVAGFRSSCEGWSGDCSPIPPDFGCPPDDCPEHEAAFQEWLASRG